MRILLSLFAILIFSNVSCAQFYTSPQRELVPPLNPVPSLNARVPMNQLSRSAEVERNVLYNLNGMDVQDKRYENVEYRDGVTRNVPIINGYAPEIKSVMNSCGQQLKLYDYSQRIVYKKPEEKRNLDTKTPLNIHINSSNIVELNPKAVVTSESYTKDLEERQIRTEENKEVRSHVLLENAPLGMPQESVKRLYDKDEELPLIFHPDSLRPDYFLIIPVPKDAPDYMPRNNNYNSLENRGYDDNRELPRKTQY